MNRNNKQANKQAENRYKDEPGTTQNEGQGEENTAEEVPPGSTVAHKILLLIGILVGMTSTFAIFFVTRAPRLPELDLEEYWGLPNEENDESIRPFTIEFSDAMVDDLKTRLLHHKAPPNPLDHSGSTYGFNKHFLAEVVDYWRNKYDFKKQEQYLNQFDQFKTKIQGLDIHFIHSKPKESDLDVMPILLLHGWPGSVREFYEVIPILTDIVDKKEKNIVFEVVVPSLPGFGFSQGASRTGFGPLEMAIVLNNLMGRLGIPKYYLHGTDVGHTIGSIMATVFPENVLGFHTNNPMIAFNPVANIYVTLGSLFPFLIEKKELQNRMYPLSEKLAFYMEETGYMHIQATKPDTIGAALSDTPAGLAAYILEKFATWTHPDNKKAYDGNLTLYFPLISLLDNIMIYWATNSITTSMRVYAESFNSRNMLTIFDSIPTKVPVCGIKFKHELIYQPDSIVRIKYHNLLRTELISVGGHFPAMELPTILARNIFDSVYLMQLFHKNHKDKIKPVRAPESVYDFIVKDIRGMDVRLSKYRGHVLLIVNVASQCGLTDTNYQELNELHDKYYDKGLRILAFPCNQFYSQEPGTPREILQFTKQKGVKFDIFAKVEVNGDNTHPLWAFLKEKKTGTLGNFIKWNFSKFLVDREGNPVKRFGPEKDPLKIEPFLVQYL